MASMNPISDDPSPLVHSVFARLIVCACAAAVICSASCGDEEPKGPPPTHEFELEVSVTDESETPVAKAPVMLDGNTVGYTDREGLFHAVINEREGAEIQLSVGEIDDYLIPDDATRLETLKLTKSLEGGMKAVSVAMHTSVRSMRTDYLVWIDVECDEFLGEKCTELPVMVDGEERARTDQNGAAHFVVTGVPESSIEVNIPTPKFEPSADDDDEDSGFVMKPESPSYQVDLGLDPEVLLIKESFKDPVAAEKAAEARKERKRRQRIRQRRRARRNASKAKKEKKEKESEVIDLW